MIGTPGFVGARLTEAREARGITGTSLAEIADLKPASVSQYEHGKQSPTPATLERLSAILNRPQAYFLKPIPKRNRAGINYRSRSAATKRARERAEARFGWLKEYVSYLRSYMDFPLPDIPILSESEDPASITLDQAEDSALEVRLRWKLAYAPIADLLLILENHGVIVSRGLLEADTLDAFSQWDGGLPFIFLGADKDSAVRSRFDAAHELGHLVLHSRVPDSKRKSSSVHAVMEKQADRFAGAFLLPEFSFRQELFAPTLASFRALKPRWKVSMAAMIMRCEQLGIMGQTQVTRSFINLGRKGWRKREPLDDVLPIEEPRLLRRCVQLLVESGTKSKQQIISDLVETPSDVESLLTLAPGYFDPEREKITNLPVLKSDDDSPGPAPQKPGKVVTFRRG